MIGTITMTMANPLLAESDHPRFLEIRPEHIVPAVEAAISAHRTVLDGIRREAHPDFASVILAKEHGDAALSRVWSPVSHLKSVADTPALRAAHQAAQPLLTAYFTSVGQDAGLYSRIESVLLERGSLSAVESRAVELSARAFRLSGVALPEPQRTRIGEVQQELARLSTEFSDAVLDATLSWTLAITDEARLAGIPETERALLAANAREKGLEGWLITLHAPLLLAVLGFADDRELRAEILRASATRASDQGPQAGRYDNGARIVQTLGLRAERARLLGFSSAAALSLHTKMARDPDEVEAFLLDLAHRARPRAETELTDLRTHAAMLGLDHLEPWDVGYVAEKLRHARHAIDQAEIRRYFPLPVVLDGLFGLLSELFDIEAEEMAGAEAWHPDVRFVTIKRGGVPVAGLYLDLYARAGKRGGAWMDVCRPRLRAADRDHLPTAYLTCNFAPPADGNPALLAHGEVVTLFHETGHCLHHVLSRIDLPSIGGISGVEWDAIELPSQLMENFAWDPQWLARLSRHIETGRSLPDPLIARMIEARQFMGGLALLRQVELALVDLRLHRIGDPDENSAASVLAAVRDEVAVMPSPEWARPLHSFSHIFAGSYASGYYSYLWAERLSSDAFERFAGAAEEVRSIGRSFLDEVLAVGGSRPALESFVAFRGREPDNAPLLRARGLAAA